jgi:hypothetical protein
MAYTSQTQKAGKIPGSMPHKNGKIDISENTLRKRKTADNADTLSRSLHSRSGDNGAADSTRRRHNHSEDGGTWPNRKRRSRRSYTSAHNRKRRKPKPT